MDWVRGIQISFIQPPNQTTFPKNNVPASQQKLYDSVVRDLLHIGAISACTREREEFISSYFLAKKPNGNYRFILNLKKLNEFITPPHFKLEDYRTVTKLLTPECYLATIDLKDAYFLLPIQDSNRKYLRFIFRNTRYQFNCLPFGLNIAPYVFTKLLKPVIKYLRAKGILSVIYLDDILLIGRTKQDCLWSIRQTRLLLRRLGFLINEEKSVLTPSQEVKFLGFQYNTAKMIMYLPQDKKENICKELRVLKTKTHCKIRLFAKLIGKLVSAGPLVQYSWVHIKDFEREKFLALKGDKSYNRIMRIPAYLQTEFRWWIDNIQSSFQYIKPRGFNLEIFSDASKTGWGAICGDETAQGFWKLEEKSYHINYLELLAAWNGLRAFGKSYRGYVILLRIDNKTAIACINKKGSVQHLKLGKITKQIWQWCEEKQIHIFASYIPTKQNRAADKQSRITEIETEYELNENTFRLITKNLGQPTIDLFASCVNKKCERFVSWKPDPDSLYVDAFTLNWKSEYFYAFPPFSLISRVLEKIQSEGARGILVVPFWPSQPWFPLFNKLLNSEPLYLGPDENLLLSPFRLPHPLYKTLTLMAGRLSGRQC